MPMAVATLRRVTPAQARSACSSMSPEQASLPSPPVAGWKPARTGPAQLCTVAVMPPSERSARALHGGAGGLRVVPVLLLERGLQLPQRGGVHAGSSVSVGCHGSPRRISAGAAPRRRSGAGRARRAPARSWSASSSAVVARRGRHAHARRRARRSPARGRRGRAAARRASPSPAAPTRCSSMFEDGVGAVVEDDRGHVEVLAGLGPQRLDRVHRAAVGLQADHRAVGAGDRGAGGERAGPRRSRRRSASASRARGAPAVALGQADAGGVRLVDDDRALGQQRADHGRQRPSRSSSPVGQLGRGAGSRRRRGRRAPAASASACERGDGVLRRRGEHVHLAALGHRGRSACRGRRRTTPATSRRPGPGAGCRRARRSPTRRGRRAARHAGSPAPRSSRAGNVSASSWRPVPAGDPGRGDAGRASRIASPPRSSTAGSPERSTLGDVVDHRRRRPRARGGRRAGRPASPPSAHDTSAGRISVATPPGAARAAATASAASAATVVGRRRAAHPAATRCRRPPRCRTPAARRSCLWYVAWSPTMLTIGVRARRALCRLARPLPSPGPRCSSVAAGRPAMRA